MPTAARRFAVIPSTALARLVPPHHRPAARRAGAALAAVVIALAAVQARSELERERDAWGATAPAVVARRGLDAGHVIGPDDVRSVDWPTAVLPPGTADEVAPGSVVRRAVGEGEVLTLDDLAPPGRWQLVPDGWRVVGVPQASVGGLPIHTGDAVEVVVSGVVRASGVVAEVLDEAVALALPAAEAGTVAEAVARGEAVLLLAPTSVG